MIKFCTCGCGNQIPQDRIEALIFLETPENLWTIKEHSNVRPIRGIYTGFSGASAMIMTDCLGKEEGYAYKDGSEEAKPIEDESEAETVKIIDN